jgi:hypothetical protein
MTTLIFFYDEKSFQSSQKKSAGIGLLFVISLVELCGDTGHFGSQIDVLIQML